MSDSLNTIVHVREDSDNTFNVKEMLLAEGYVVTGDAVIADIFVVNSQTGDLELLEASNPLLSKVDDQTFAITASHVPNYFGEFEILSVVVDLGNGEVISLQTQVVIDAVNDHPVASDKDYVLTDFSALVIQEADFSFDDPVEGDDLRSVYVTSLPAIGTLLLNGSPVTVGTDIPAQDIRDGKLTYQPEQGQVGLAQFGFRVRDDGCDCATQNLSVTPNYLNFLIPPSSVGNFVFNDDNRNGVQDDGETGVAGVAVTLIGAGKDGVFGTGDDTTEDKVTDGNGLYQFDQLGASKYKLEFSGIASDKAFTAKDQGGDDALDSDVNALGRTAEFNLGIGQSNTTLDAGLVTKLGAIGDYAFLDRNRNGVQDPTEAYTSVVVKLHGAGADGQFGTGDDTTDTQETDQTGHYLFNNLLAGKYQVEFVNDFPSLVSYAAANVGGDDTRDSDIDPTTGLSQVIDLAAGEINTTVDGGFVINPASVGDFVFYDKNGNGVQDAGEAGVANVTVTLTGAGRNDFLGSSNNTVVTTTTDSTGHYLFTGLETITDYQITFSALPSGYAFTTANTGSDDSIDSDAGIDGKTNVFQVQAGSFNDSFDAGLVAKAGSVGDFVFIDKNGNGVQDTGEAGVAGAKVILTGAGLDGTFGTADDTSTDTTTDANGKYVFNNVAGDQDYKVSVSNTPAGYAFTAQGAGSDRTADSDVDASGNSNAFHLNAGETKTDIDAGLVAKAGSVGDFVFIDKNGNGVQDTGEAGVSGAKVILTGAGLDGTFGTADDTTTDTTTDANGKYVFNNVAGDQDYKVSVSNTPAGYAFTTQGAGADRTADSDVNSSGVTNVFRLNAGQTRTDIDAGLVAKVGSVGDFVFIDKNGNGVQDAGDVGVAGAKVTLSGAGLDGTFGTADDTSTFTTTDTNGKYVFNNVAGEQDYMITVSNTPAGYAFTTQGAGVDRTADSDVNSSGATNVFRLNAGQTRTDIDAGLVAVSKPTACVGDRVWYDDNKNGLQDSCESGVAGVTVKLRGAGADNVFGTGDDTLSPTLTDSCGFYKFSGLIGGQQYQLQFGTKVGYGFTTQDVGTNDACDSDAAKTTGLTKVFTLADGECNTSYDAGLVCRPTACVGDRVWNDVNKNGLQDCNEGGLAGVKVVLTGAGADGVWGNADDVCLSTTTDCNGYYKFSGLIGEQQYQLQFGTLAGYGRTLLDVGTNDACDSDANTATGLTKVFTLADGECNTSYDAGLFCRPTACVGDRVWIDTNRYGIQDCNEAGAGCVTVTLRGAGADGIWGNADDVCKTTTTDSCGYYKFAGLAGEQQYQLQFGTLTGYTRTALDVGTNDTIDSDANVTTGLTKVFTLADGECNTSFDAGLLCRLTASVGDRVWNDCNNNGVQDAGEGGLACVSVKLTGAGLDGVWGNADDVCLTTTTDACGYYKFSGLTGGQQYQLQFGTLYGYGRSAQDVGTNDAADSDANTATGLTKVFTLADGECNTSFDAGLFCKPTATVGDRVWNDCNGNGIQDAGEAGLACVSVKLTGAGADGIWGNADDVCKTTTTDSCGYYKFTGLTGGEQYKLQFGTLAGYTYTDQDKGTNDALDSDVDACGTTKVFTLAAGECNTSIDAGLFKQVTACIVGSTSIYEGCSASYQVKLSAAVSSDTWLTVTALDGTARRTSVDASCQNLSGVTAQNNDYALIGTDCRIDADGVISVKVAAGQTCSSSFSLAAWKENVSVDFFTYLCGGYKEAAWENLSLNLSNSTNALVTVGSSNLCVNIGDTTTYSLSSPIALDMDGNGIHTTALIDSKGTFDLLGNGHAVNSGWLSSGDAFLAIDNNSNGKIDSISELFGGNKGEGFAKLGSFDTNHDGLVDAKDADFSKLLVWQDLNGDHATDAGELRTLGEAGIASLSTGFTDGAVEQLGNVLGETSVATRTDGTQITTTDVYFNTDVDGASLPELASLLSSTNTLLDQALGTAQAAAPAAPAANDANVTADAETLRQLAALLEQHAVAA